MGFDVDSMFAYHNEQRAALRLGNEDLPAPEQGLVLDVVPAGAVVMSRQDWLAISDAVAIAKVSGRLSATQLARIDSIQIQEVEYEDATTWAVNPQIGDKVAFTSGEYPAAGERTGTVTAIGENGWGHPQVYVSGARFGDWVLVAAFNDVLHSDQPNIARIITD